MIIKRSYIFLLILMLIISSVSSISYASKATNDSDLSVEAKQFAFTQANRVIEVAKKVENEKDFIKFLNKEVPKIVAIKYMALWVLGNNRSKFTPQQLKEFIDIFSNNLITFYGTMIYQNKDKNFSLINSRSAGPNVALVKFVILVDKNKLDISWQVKKNKEDKLLVTDFIINGISFLQTKRTEYNAVFQKSHNNPEEFLKNCSKEEPSYSFNN